MKNGTKVALLTILALAHLYASAYLAQTTPGHAPAAWVLGCIGFGFVFSVIVHSDV